MCQGRYIDTSQFELIRRILVAHSVRQVQRHKCRMIVEEESGVVRRLMASAPDAFAWKMLRPGNIEGFPPSVRCSSERVSTEGVSRHVAYRSSGFR